jgi:hypothetical protein
VKDDIEQLREWKNAHRLFFFHKDIITPEQQSAWYLRWSQETHDHMFMVDVDGCAIGCVGVRRFEGTMDAYNIILGDKTFEGRGIMSVALGAVGAFAMMLYPSLPICVRVLMTNPAVGWYKRNGYRLVAENAEYVTLEWDCNFRNDVQCALNVTLPFVR